jgi:hypothetical protein
MIETDLSHCEIVEKSLNGERAVDDQTFASLAILSERLERLKKVNEVFENVAFSAAVEKLKEQKNAVAVR